MSCGDSESDYGKRHSSDTCTRGISIQYNRGFADGEEDWVEELWIPQIEPPCGGTLEITARNHFNLFRYPIRFKQCDLNNDCPVDAQCMPTPGFNINYEFSNNANMCARRLGAK